MAGILRRAAAKKPQLATELTRPMAMPNENNTGPPSLRAFYGQAASLSCRLFLLRDRDKLPRGKWQEKSGDLSGHKAAQAVETGGANIGIVPGPRVVLVDVDGPEALARFQAAFPDLQPTAKTPRGYHFWLVCPEGHTIAGLGVEQGAGDTTLGLGVDTRTPGKGYGVGPGSVLDARAYKGKTPPAGGPTWSYELTGGMAEVNPESLVCLRKGQPAPAIDRDGAASELDAPARPAQVVALKTGLSLPSGQRDDKAFALAASLFDNGRISFNAALDFMREVARQLIDPDPADPFTDAELEKCVKSAYKAATEKRPEWMGKRVGVYYNPIADNETDNFRAKLAALGVQVCHNERDQRMEIKQGRGDWRHGDGPMAALYVNLDANAIPYPNLVKAKSGGPAFSFPKVKKLPKHEFKTQLDAEADRRKRDPVLERIAELRRDMDAKLKTGELTPDILTAYLPDFLKVCFDYEAAYEQAAKYALIVPLCGVVRRAFAPGCQHDITTLLIGPMGIGKSTLWRCLVFETGHFTDGVRFNTLTDPRASAEQTEGAAIVELSEMAAVRRADVEITLSELTRCQTPRHRRAYKAQTETRAYRHVYVGTANRTDSVPTINGENRRLLPLALHAKHGVDNQQKLKNALAVPVVFRLIWQAAIFLALDGAKDPEGGDFTGSRYEQMLPDIEQTARALTAKHRQGEDPELAEMVDDWRNDMEIQEGGKGWPFSALVAWMETEQHMPGKGNYATLIRQDWKLKDALKKAGWTQGTVRYKGAPKWGWKPPAETAPASPADAPANDSGAAE